MLAKIGKAMQVAALVLLPVSILLQLGTAMRAPIGVSVMLLLMLFGIALFGAGRVVEGYGAK